MLTAIVEERRRRKVLNHEVIGGLGVENPRHGFSNI